MIDEYDRSSPRRFRPARPRPASSTTSSSALRMLLFAFVLSAALYGTSFFGFHGWKSPLGWIKKMVGGDA
jgi:hypothetical protein